MSSYIFTIAENDRGNWEICKSAKLLGTRSSLSAQSAAEGVQSGDVIYIWRGGGARKGGGLIAKVTVTGRAIPARGRAPWPKAKEYTWLIPVEITNELRKPIPDRFPSNRRGTRFLVQNTDLQKGLRELTAESAARFEDVFA